MFKDRSLLIATQHGKERIIAPIFEKEFGVKCIVNKKFDTDSLGTFSGEIERKKDVFTTLRQKCFSALEYYKCDLVISSEGSFGSHPTAFFLPANEEYLMFLDLKNNLEIIVKELSTSTNFNGNFVSNENELIEFSTNVGFPSHGLILKSDEHNFSKIYKGTSNEKDLKLKFYEILNIFGKVFVETDMRACYNPTRMSVIEQTTLKLVRTIQSKCPNCEMPGFAITDLKKGLRCGLCNFPTNSILSEIYECKGCHYINEKKFPKNKEKEDPMYCDYCNP